MSERDEVQGARNAETEIVRGVQRGCEVALSRHLRIARSSQNEVSVKTNLQVMSELKNRVTQQFARIATHEVFPKFKMTGAYRLDVN